MKAQALIYQPELTHSVWTDVYSQALTEKALRNQMQKRVKSGEYIGYRLITIHEEHIGITWKSKP